MSPSHSTLQQRPRAGTLRELLAWPAELLRDIPQLRGGQELMDRLSMRLQIGIDIRTAFSGIDCFHMAANLLGREAKRSAIDASISCVETSDSDPLCRMILRSWPNKPPEHEEHSNIMMKLVPEVQAKIMEISKKHSKAFKARCQAGELHSKEKSELRTQLSHQVYQEMAEELHKPEAFRDGNLKFARERAKQTHCLKRLTLAVAGTPCVHWSMQGDRLCLLGESNGPFFTWAFERYHMEEDLIVHENTEMFEESWLVRVLGGKYHVLAIMVSPADIGFPSRRMRKWTLFANKAKFAGWSFGLAEGHRPYL